jgi:hypothetical protein
MTGTMTAPALTAQGAAVRVRIEDDATPIVRLIGRTLRDAARAGHAVPTREKASGTVAVRSHDTPQAATISFSEAGIEVTSGVLPGADATITVDLHGRFAPTAEPSGDVDLAAAVLSALQPPLPEWRVAAEHFWNVARSVPGIPDVLVAVTEGPEGLEQVVLGEGTTHYLVAGAPDTLAGVFSGADDLFAVLSAGLLGIQGTLSQLSVMTGASWKVRFDV